MVNEICETYRVIEDLCNINLGVGDKHILKNIILESKEKNIEFFVGGGQYILRKFSDFFPSSKSFDIILKKIEKSEENALNQWKDYKKNKNIN